MLELLGELSADKRNVVYIVSGRDSYTLAEWLGHLPVSLVAEHGALFKDLGSDWTASEAVGKEWIKSVSKIMDKYVQYCPGSFIERKSYSVAWYYRNTADYQSMLCAADLYNELQAFSDKLNIHVVNGNKVVEVRNKGINKGEAVKRILRNRDFDFIFSCGDDTTDEDMFYQLSGMDDAYTIKVGSQASYAKFNLHTTEMVLSLLKNFTGIRG